MKTRIVVHKAFDKQGLARVLAEVAGQCIPFDSNHYSIERWRARTAKKWVEMGFGPTK